MAASGSGLPSGGSTITVSTEEALQFLDTEFLYKKTITDVHGKTHVMKSSPICGGCNAGYSEHPQFPLKPDGSPRLFFCGKCRNQRYCSKECQKKDWPKHKIVCQDAKIKKNDARKVEFSNAVDNFAEVLEQSIGKEAFNKIQILKI